MQTELNLHLQQGRDAIIKAALDGTLQDVPLDRVVKVLDTLVENGALSVKARLGVLFVDARLINQSGKKTSS